jgi:metallo-beta-lactamase family protein
MWPLRLHFLGAQRQVTGSRYLLEAGGARILVDCGMFQERDYQDRNWEPSPVAPGKITAALLTHAHVDHCGLLPRLVREGFRGPIYATPATSDLAELILYDAAQIQVEDAAFKRKRHRKEGRRSQHPEVPLFTEKEVRKTIPLFEAAPYGEPVRINDRVQAVCHDAGHILGSSIIDIEVRENGSTRRVVFSGDLGQWGKPILRDPTLLEEADYVVMESTYGDRDHQQRDDIETQLAEVISQTVAAGGNVVVPTFAVERAQELMYHISRLSETHRIPDVPVFLDSPMAADATELFDLHRECYDEEMWQRINSGRQPLRFRGLRIVRTVEESKTINELREPAIIMSPSGMCTNGRIKHHLAHNISRPESTILFAGFQVRGTLGRQILDGNREVRIHGRQWLVRARIAELQGISGHADRSTLLRWLGGLKRPPRQLFLTHGEEQASLALAGHLGSTLGWQAAVPKYQDTIELS